MATVGSTSTQSSDCILLKCPVCLEKMKRPRSLPCFHSFCELCIQSLIEKMGNEVQKDGQKAFECPVSRTKILSPNSNISAEEWSKVFSLNHLMITLGDHGSNNLSVNCDPCSRIEEQKPAKFRCQDCRDYLCEFCYTHVHKRLKGSSSHSISDVSENSPPKSIEIDEFCMIHKDKGIDVYCFDHDSLCCSMCLLSNHIKCRKVKSIDEVVADEDRNLDLKELISLLNTLTINTSSAKESTKQNIKALETKQSLLVETVSSHIDEVKDKLDTLRDQFEKKVNQTHYSEKQTLELTDGRLSGFLTTLEDCSAVATTVSLHGSKWQQFFTVQRIKFRISDHLKKLEKLIADNGQSDYNFTKNENFYHGTENILNSVNIGDICTENSNHGILSDVQSTYQSYCSKAASKGMSEITFRHTFINVSNIEISASKFSPSFKLGNIPWKIKCKHNPSESDDQQGSDKSGFLAVYLICLLKLGDMEWSYTVEVEIRLVNHTCKKKNVTSKFVKEFTNASTGWGINKLMKWNELFDCNNGYIQDDSFTL